jgi:hypothetical protein
VKLQSETYLEGVPNFQEQLLRRAKTETEKRLESYSDDELETRIESMQRKLMQFQAKAEDDDRPQQKPSEYPSSDPIERARNWLKRLLKEKDKRERRVHSPAARNLSQAMNKLTHLSDTLHIPTIVKEIAALIYRKAMDKGLIRGRSITSIAAAALYLACRLTQTPQNLKEIAEASTRRQKEISRYYQLLQHELEIPMPMDDPHS